MKDIRIVCNICFVCLNLICSLCVNCCYYYIDNSKYPFLINITLVLLNIYLSFNNNIFSMKSCVFTENNFYFNITIGWLDVFKRYRNTCILKILVTTQFFGYKI